MRITWLVLAALGLGLAYGAQMARWLRVLQREDYEPGSMYRFWRRWTWPPRGVAGAAAPRSSPGNWTALVLWITLPVALVVALAAKLTVIVVIDSLLYGLTCPWGLSPRGRTGALKWTRRLRTLALVTLLLSVLFILVGTGVHEKLLFAALVVWLVPLLVALSAGVLAPYESRLAARFVQQARQRLDRVHPTVVAITGSYGKTSTKNHVADLLASDGGVVATPKSFNNRAGLSRAINENLNDDTRVFVAEMGTYGPGEIREMCAWCAPDVAVITAIGPVHLERMKSLGVIEAAKFEITERARVVVLNVDDPLLASWPERLGDRRVRRAGSVSSADVRVAPVGEIWRVWVEGVEVAELAPVPGVQPTNVACAIAAALEVGALVSELPRRLASLRAVDHRANVATAASGVVVIDDTFNANPTSARASLAVLSGLGVGRRVVVTPGLIELGSEQGARNEVLAREIAGAGAELVIVGRTNAAALSRGFGVGARSFRVRDDAVAWVRESLAAGDAVLYLNDLPDHYP